MHNTRRFRGALRFFVSLFLIVFSCSWLSLYFDSIYQRQKAERFISDLRSFPFATAGFVEVRDLAIRHGGTALQSAPQHLPFTCTVRDCTFEVSVKPRILRLPLEGRAAELLYSTLPYCGIRPWSVFASFEVSDGRLARSRTAIGQLRRGRLGGYEGLLPIEYAVSTDRTATPYSNFGVRGDEYVVGPPTAITGPPEELWTAWVLQTTDAPMRRAFDVDLRCFTSVLRGCTGFRELAPSAWVDHEARLAKFRQEEERQK